MEKTLASVDAIGIGMNYHFATPFKIIFKKTALIQINHHHPPEIPANFIRIHYEAERNNYKECLITENLIKKGQKGHDSYIIHYHHHNHHCLNLYSCQ